QTVGRGRRERQWVSPPGNLYASLCLDISGLPDENLSVLSLAIGVAIHRCVSELIASDVRLKWPNDVLIDGAKCCGILLERQVEAATGAVGLIAGIGLNVDSNPADTPYPATNLKAHGFVGTLASVFDRLAAAIAETIAGLRSQGFVTAIQNEWLAYAKGVGEPVRVHLANETVEGVFERLDDHGRLQLRLGDGTVKTITAGDVFFS
ncbi:MAG: biotin--[acetyl-CoA-carboxylase] ligase, partial [Pseudomonadota bacterium]